MALPQDMPDDLPLLEQAAGWFDKQSGQAMSREDLEAFARWRENPDNVLAFAEIEAAHADARQLANAPEILGLRHEALSRIVLPYARRRRLWTGGAIAASVAALFAVTNIQNISQFLTTDTLPSVQAAVAHPSIYQTAVGEQLTVALSDGSSVSLNTNSRVRLAYNKAERRLILEQGQALFHVAKGQARPFVVQALDRIVTAHGTTFDVRIAAGNKIRVSLVEGAISVAGTRKNAPAPSELKAKDVLVASGDEVRVTREDQIEREVSWRDGLIIFEDDSLAQATAEVNRYVNTPIVLQDERLREVRVSGAFRTGETGAFVEALQMSFPVRVISRTDGKIVLGYRS